MNESDGNFSTPSDVLKIITDLELSLNDRSEDRAMINVQFNGGRPFTPAEEKEHQIQVNANFLEGYKIAQNGILQMNSALLYKDRFFTARCLRGKVTKRQQWSEKFTTNLHKSLKTGKSGKKFTYLMQNRNATLVLHGVGALWWSNNYEWMPKFVALDDLLVPTDTALEFSDELGHFGINSWLTPWQLFQMTQAEKSDPGWDKELAMAILKSMLESKNFTPDYFDQPEKIESLWKQRSVYLNSDSVPKVKITTFYHQDPESGKWWRKVLVRENQSIGITSISTDKFLYQGKQEFSDDIGKILHMQYGDGSVVAPFKYRSVRGLGVLLFSVIELMNRLRCQFTQHVFQNLVPLLRIDNPTDTDRPRMMQMQPYGVVEPGVSFVKADERHQIDPRLVQDSMSEFRQLMSESSATYVQEIDNGTNKAQTLGEAQIKLQSANKIVSSMLTGAYQQECFLFEEIIKRFLMKTSDDEAVKAFQMRCKADGIPDELMVASAWSVDITKVFGAGDQTLAQQEVSSLMAIAQQLDPTAQRTVRREYITVMTRNPELALELVPEEQNTVTDGRKAAEDVFGTLMLGVPIGLREGIEQQDYVAAMLAMMEAVIQRIHQTDDVGTPQDVIGLQNVSRNLEQHIQILSQDPNEKEAVAAAGKELGKMMNDVKAFGQRQAEAQQKQRQDPEVMAKIQSQQMLTESKLKSSQVSTAQKLHQKQVAFDQKQQQDAERHAAEMQKLREQSELEQQSQALKTASAISAQEEKTAADIANAKKKAAAAPAKPKSPE